MVALTNHLMEHVRSHVLQKLYGQKHPRKVVGLEKEYDLIYSCLKNTIIQKRGHQCLLLGAEATGKSLLISKALAQLEAEFPEQYLVVKVNGLIHGDDKSALRSIAQQLDSKLHTNGDNIETIKMSQTMQNINALFDSASFNENSEQKISVVFIVEEFQKFCQMHQVLAYELLNFSQTCPFGVAFIGVSKRSNVVELLEKRNRSRNSAISVFLPRPKTVAGLEAIAYSILAVDDEEVLEKYPEEVEMWNSYLEQQLAATIAAIAKDVFYLTNSPAHLCQQLLPSILNITELTNPSQSLMALGTSESLTSDADNVAELDWALLICAARSQIKFNTQTVNLVIVMDEWRQIAKETHIARFSTHNITSLETPGTTKSSILLAKHAWERLINLGLLQPVNANDGFSELKMYVPELNIDDLKLLLKRSFSLYSWTDLN